MNCCLLTIAMQHNNFRTSDLYSTIVNNAAESTNLRWGRHRFLVENYKGDVNFDFTSSYFFIDLVIF